MLRDHFNRWGREPSRSSREARPGAFWEGAIAEADLGAHPLHFMVTGSGDRGKRRVSLVPGRQPTMKSEERRETMRLDGFCHCGAVRFSVDAYAPVPYLRCHCSICRKTAGGGGYAINLGAKADTLEVEGEEAIAVFHATDDGEESPAERRFCSRCGAALWSWHPAWPALVPPFARFAD